MVVHIEIMEVQKK